VAVVVVPLLFLKTVPTVGVAVAVAARSRRPAPMEQGLGGKKPAKVNITAFAAEIMRTNV
jgi:hypothetical protein